MIDFDFESILFALLLIPILLSVLLVYALLGAFILVHHATCLLARILRLPVYRFFSYIFRQRSTMQPHSTTPTFGLAVHNEAQQLAFIYLVVLAHHWRHF